MKSASIPYYLNVIVVLVLSGLFMAPLMVDQELYDPTRMGKIFFFTQWMLLLIPVGIIVVYLNWKQPIDKLSLIVMAWGIWIVSRGKIGGIWHDEKFFWFSGCFVFYFLASTIMRSLMERGWQKLMLIPVITIVLVAAAESIFGILQLYDMYPVHHVQFKITGTFFNPAPYAGFLVVSLPWGLLLTAINQNNRLGKAINWLGYVSACLIFIAISSSQSRAAYLGLGSVLLVWLSVSLHPLLYVKRILNTSYKRTLAYIIVPLLVACVFLGLYRFKKDSASGRILIWKVAVRTIAEQPIIGHGFNTIQAKLLPEQAAYFTEGNGNENERMLAGSTRWVFNEFLQITSELGLIGLALFLFAVAYALFYKMSSLSRQHKLACGAARGTLVGILVFGCFSYPFYSLPIVLLFFFSFAILSALPKKALGKGESNYVAISRIPILIGSACLVAFYIIYTPKLKQAYWLWHEAMRLSRIGASGIAIEAYAEAYPFIEYNGLFLQQYGKCLAKEEKIGQAIKTLNVAVNYYCDVFSYIILGDCYQKIKKYSAAEEQYRIAINMVPHKFYALYRLAKMYEESGQNSKAKEIAEMILEKKIKVSSRAIEEIKQEMQQLIEANASLQDSNKFEEKGRKSNVQINHFLTGFLIKQESEVW